MERWWIHAPSFIRRGLGHKAPPCAGVAMHRDETRRVYALPPAAEGLSLSGVGAMRLAALDADSSLGLTALASIVTDQTGRLLAGSSSRSVAARWRAATACSLRKKVACFVMMCALLVV